MSVGEGMWVKNAWVQGTTLKSLGAGPYQSLPLDIPNTLMRFSMTESAKSNLFWPAYCSWVSQNSSLSCQENRILPFHACCHSFASSTSSRRECDHRLRFWHKEKRGIFSPILKKVFLLLRSPASGYYLSIYFTILHAIFKLGALPQKKWSAQGNLSSK